MTEKDKIDRTSTAAARRRNTLLILIVTGIIAGLMFVYGIEGLQRNDPDAVACQSQENPAIKAAITGEVAALTMAPRPNYVGDLSFTGPDGARASLANFSGKVILLNLWATWCAPCKREMPYFNTLQQNLGSNDFEVVAVNIDTQNQARPKKFLNDIKADKLIFYSDSSAKIFDELKQRGRALGMPVTVLIDREGCEIATLNGPAEWASDDAVGLIEATLETSEQNSPD